MSGLEPTPSIGRCVVHLGQLRHGLGIGARPQKGRLGRRRLDLASIRGKRDLHSSTRHSIGNRLGLPCATRTSPVLSTMGYYQRDGLFTLTASIWRFDVE